MMRLVVLVRVLAVSIAALALGCAASTPESVEDAATASDASGEVATTGGGDGASSGDATASIDDSGDTTATVKFGTILDVLKAKGQFGLFLELATKVGADQTMGRPGHLTVFAPTDDAVTTALAAFGKSIDDFKTVDDFTKLADMVQLHIVQSIVMSDDLVDGASLLTMQGGSLDVTVSDGVILVAGATVVEADIAADNGVIHAVDAIITIKKGNAPTLLEALAKAGQFNSFLLAVTKSGLDITLSEVGPFTALAPTDPAFLLASIDVQTYETPEQLEALGSFVRAHVVAQRFKAAELTDGQHLTTLGGQDLVVSVKDGQVHVGAALLLPGEHPASNGMIEPIDVLLAFP